MENEQGNYTDNNSSYSTVDTSKAERSAWLMKCPPAVSKAWESAAAASDSPPVAKVVVSLDPLNPEGSSSLEVYLIYRCLLLNLIFGFLCLVL